MEIFNSSKKEHFVVTSVWVVVPVRVYAGLSRDTDSLHAMVPSGHFRRKPCVGVGGVINENGIRLLGVWRTYALKDWIGNQCLRHIVILFVAQHKFICPSSIV